MGVEARGGYRYFLSFTDDLSKYGYMNLMKHTRETFDACEPCLMGKMTKTTFSGTMERASDLLETIHTDVCGVLMLVAGIVILRPS